MRRTERRVAQEPGSLVYRFAATLDDPDEYLHVQEWTDDTAFADHQSSAAFRDYQHALFDMLAGPSEMRVYRGAQTTRPEPSGPGDPRAAD